MLKREALIESISSNLHNFLKKIGKNLSLPDKKFLRDSTIGLIRCGKPTLRMTQIGGTKGRDTDRNENLTMVVSRLDGVNKPMMMRTNLTIEKHK